eukprot:COSAG01_NODE_1148_length_11519_cov_3.641944_4_plen_64_part_00
MMIAAYRRHLPTHPHKHTNTRARLAIVGAAGKGGALNCKDTRAVATHICTDVVCMSSSSCCSS